MVNDAQVKDAIVWLSDHWQGDRKCPICGRDEWSVSEPVELGSFNTGQLMLGGPVYPMVLVTCLNCGHVLFFNAMILGLISEDAEADQPQDDEAEQWEEE